MEFPHLGKNCKSESCQQLDFLPINCDLCSLTFCNDHCNPIKHNCKNLVIEPVSNDTSVSIY